MNTTEKAKAPEEKVGHDKSESEKSKESKIQVHSANAWEAADLGDTDRKNKFLRLMGAGKKEHRGRFVIGDHEPAHTRPSKDTENLELNLEDQYQQSLAHRMAGGRRGHIGLGFHDEDSSEGEGNEESKDKNSGDSQEQKDDDDPECGAEGEQGSAGEPDEDDEEEETSEENVDDGIKEKDRQKKRGGSSSSQDESNVKKMKFVKGSS